MAPDLSAIESRLRHHVDVLAGLIGERNSRRPSALFATRAYLMKELGDLGLEVTQHSYPHSAHETVNLSVTIVGRKPSLPMLIVGAHYDTAPTTPGADDNASAVAALLEIVRSLRGRTLKRTICCIFYDCEEPPHFGTKQMGSFQDARMRRERGDAVHGIICLESIGYFPCEVPASVDRPRIIRWIDRLLGGRYLVIVSDVFSVSFGLPFVARFFTSGIIRCIAVALPRRTGVISLSDHRSYWQHGYRALMVTNTAMLRNPHYHTPGDLPNTLDYRRMARINRMLCRAILRTCRSLFA